LPNPTFHVLNKKANSFRYRNVKINIKLNI
jgi:hypothetical protein